MTMKYGFENPSPGLGQAQLVVRIQVLGLGQAQLVVRIQVLGLVIFVFNDLR
jgi:hypothetical protein